jgi:hypothetical protein
VRTQTGGTPYAIGTGRRGCFYVRCIRFGKLAASYERRDGEHIYAVMLTLALLPSKPMSTTSAEASTPPSTARSTPTRPSGA